MGYLCSYAKITFYRGAWPDTASPFVLLSDSHLIDEQSAISGGIESISQKADYIDGLSPDFWNRGNTTTPLEFTETRKISDPQYALSLALALAEAKPSETGWLKIEMQAFGREFGVAPALVRGLSWRHDPRGGYLHLTWRVETGTTWEIVGDGQEGMLAYETGRMIGTEDGDNIGAEDSEE